MSVVVRMESRRAGSGCLKQMVSGWICRSLTVDLRLVHTLIIFLARWRFNIYVEMERVVEALHAGENALLESPTGRHPADPRRCRDDATTRDPDPALERAFDDPLTSSTPLRRRRRYG